jgi:hypothetical protein
MSNLHRGPGIDASYQVSVHLAKRFQRRRFFLNRPMSSKDCLWWPSLLTDRDRMNNLFRRSYIDASYQVSVHFGQAVSEEKIFKKSTNQKQELPIVAMFVNRSGRNVQSL